jgi:hypothetical protein
MKTWNCRVDLRDHRCPDGCCGNVEATVTSPVTGRKVKLDLYAIPQPARDAIVKAVVASLPRNTDPHMHRDVLNGSTSARLSKSDLQTILAKEGACYC